MGGGITPPSDKEWHSSGAACKALVFTSAPSTLTVKNKLTYFSAINFTIDGNRVVKNINPIIVNMGIVNLTIYAIVQSAGSGQSYIIIKAAKPILSNFKVFIENVDGSHTGEWTWTHENSVRNGGENIASSFTLDKQKYVFLENVICYEISSLNDQHNMILENKDEWVVFIGRSNVTDTDLPTYS